MWAPWRTFQIASVKPFHELLSLCPFAGYVCCSQCCTAAASLSIVNSEQSYLMPLLPMWSWLTSCSCAKLSTVASQSNPSMWIPGTDKAGLGWKLVFSLEQVACLHQKTHKFLLGQGEYGWGGSVSSRAANELLMLLSLYAKSWS